MRKIQIFDCDNVLSNDAWRIPLIDWKQESPDARYHNYHLASAFDVPGNLPLIHNAFAEDVLIFTAMPERYRKLRELWFNHNRIPYRRILMRGHDDHRTSVELKRSMLYDLFDSGIRSSDISFAWDDRPDVVEMYCKEGVAGCLVSLHNVCAYTKPKLEAV